MADPPSIYQRLRRRLMGEAGPPPESAEPVEPEPRYPERPEGAATPSQVGRLYQDWLRRLEGVYPQAAQVREWELERQRHEATVRDAQPGGDYLAVAAALAAIEVLTRHITPLRAEIERQKSEIAQAKAAYEQAWARYQAARGKLVGEELPPEEREALRQEILGLVGDVFADT